MGPHKLDSIRNGIVTGYTANLGSNNLIIKNITMNDDRNDAEYQCVIVMPGATPNTLLQIKRGNVTTLYVAGE